MSEPAEYVREIERYLCQKNGGHLVRVVGPAFELVRGWAVQGVPLRVALRGIDRCCARREAKGTQTGRRPIRIEFCEADVLDAFDDWRRAVGVGGSGPGDEVSEPRSRKPSLVQHLERAMARLAHARGPGAASTDYDRRLDAIVREIETMIPQAARARGEVRAGLIARLGELDEALVAAAIDQLEPRHAAALGRDAADDIAPFGARLPEDVRARALESAYRRLVREASRLPTLTYE
jgi:hypothetical protein